MPSLYIQIYFCKWHSPLKSSYTKISFNRIGPLPSYKKFYSNDNIFFHNEQCR